MLTITLSRCKVGNRGYFDSQTRSWVGAKGTFAIWHTTCRFQQVCYIRPETEHSARRCSTLSYYLQQESNKPYYVRIWESRVKFSLFRSCALDDVNVEHAMKLIELRVYLKSWNETHLPNKSCETRCARQSFRRFTNGRRGSDGGGYHCHWRQCRSKLSPRQIQSCLRHSTSVEPCVTGHEPSYWGTCAKSQPPKKKPVLLRRTDGRRGQWEDGVRPRGAIRAAQPVSGSEEIEQSTVG